MWKFDDSDSWLYTHISNAIMEPEMLLIKVVTIFYWKPGKICYGRSAKTCFYNGRKEFTTFQKRALWMGRVIVMKWPVYLLLTIHTLPPTVQSRCHYTWAHPLSVIFHHHRHHCHSLKGLVRHNYPSKIC